MCALQGGCEEKDQNTVGKGKWKAYKFMSRINSEYDRTISNAAVDDLTGEHRMPSCGDGCEASPDT